MEKPVNFKFVEDDKKDLYMDCISDESIRKILISITDIPKSVIEISNDQNIPLRTVYRKIQFLYDNKLLKISGAITESGKKFFLYKSKIRGISSHFVENELVVRIIANK